MSIAFVWTSVGSMQSSLISFVDMDELPAPESMSARHLMPLTSITMTGNKPSPIWFVVKATALSGVGLLIDSCAGISQMDVW